MAQVTDKKQSEIVFISPNDDVGIEDCLKPFFSVIFNKYMTEIFLNMIPSAIGYEDFFPIGLYYSLYPQIDDVNSTINKTDKLVADSSEILAIDLNTDVQIGMIRFCCKRV